MTSGCESGNERRSHPAPLHGTAGSLAAWLSIAAPAMAAVSNGLVASFVTPMLWTCGLLRVDRKVVIADSVPPDTQTSMRPDRTRSSAMPSESVLDAHAVASVQETP